jgi:predicted glycogen debranching enzyme
MACEEVAAPTEPLIHLGRDICNDLEESTSREWWLSNGIGGYASGTLSGALTRRYHGLLVAPLHPPLGRFLLFVKADALLIEGGRATPLHTNCWSSGAVAPDGFKHIEDFRLLDGMPVWRYAIDNLRIEQRIWMSHGENRTQVAFRRLSGERSSETPRIHLNLIASFRDHHGVNHPGAFQVRKQLLDKDLRLHLPRGRLLDIHSDAGSFRPDDTWIENFFLAIERERGLEDIDAHLRVGLVDIPLARDEWVGIQIGLDGTANADLATSLAAEQRRIAVLQSPALPGVEDASVPPWIRQLVTTADSFVFRRLGVNGQEKTSVIAGFPWFGDWGRDTMISLPGLTLATGRPQLAQEILESFAGYLSEGMLPNVFPGSGEIPAYNSVDAALWFIEAWRAYCTASGDWDSAIAVFPLLCEIIDAYRDGTRYGIGMDAGDGLIHAGIEGQQLTWMDARVDGHEITPRLGKPVEVNALWYNALRSMTLLARSLGKPTAKFERLSDKAAEGFARFHRGGDAGLYDVIDSPDGPDSAIRPNQIFAVSLPFSPLPTDTLQRRVVTECRRHLLTPVGLRSLSPHDGRYAGRYIGGVRERDGAYHQGPVWSWLLGHFARAEHRVTGDAATAQGRLAPMARHLKEAGLGHIGELFDGDPPHRPRGAPAQAWSLACTLEAWWRLELEKQALKQIL